MNGAAARVLVARAAHQADGLSRRLRAVGLTPVEVPLLAIDAPADGGAGLAAAVAELAAGDVAALGITSPNGAAALADAMAAAGLDPSGLAGVLVGCVGPGTARRTRQRLGVAPDFVASVHTTAGLAADFPSGTGTVVLPRADLASPDLAALLAAKGWDVRDVEAYRTRLVTEIPADVVDDLHFGAIAAVAAASPSTVQALAGAMDGRALGADIVSIGPITTARAHALDLDVAHEADPHDLDGLVAAVARAVSS